MCISDWRLGRLLRRETTAIDTSANATPSLGANPNRVMLIITLANAVAINTGLNVSINAQPLFMVSSAQPTLKVDMRESGRMCQGAVTCTKLSASNTVGAFVEIILPEDVLEAEIQQFLSSYKPYGR